ncbi:uncharacterized protein LOC110698580 [Chenopodium quinoa]|uniref:uncharacterized protein LOC110698580 n=1 Tax=Chenopodium quinoa TaxID=63459 RepID=UPI000B777EF3|nr:uncharacterized protein LOC110698580 [Chenopodium quinoa]
MVLYEREPIKKIVKRKTEFSVAKKKEEEEEKNEEEVGSSTRGGHVKFMHWVKKMSDTQKKLVHEIGLGPLLDIELPQLDKQFSHWILDSFEVSSCSFELPKGEKIEIEVEDVRIVYGLPMGDIPIVEAKSDRESEDFGVFIKNWRSKWQGKTPSVNQIIAQYTSDKFKNQRPAEEDFLTNFLVVAVNCLMKCISNNQCHFKFLFSMMDKEKIKNLNWCQYVFDSLISCHVTWRKSGGKGFYNGPLQFLMVSLQHTIVNYKMFILVTMNVH